MKVPIYNYLYIYVHITYTNKQTFIQETFIFIKNFKKSKLNLKRKKFLIDFN